jgi:hypothetical protein
MFIKEEINEEKYNKNNTKIWSKNKKDLISKENLFLKYAEKFFYPFLNRNIFKLYSEDVNLLSQLIDTLSIFVNSCGTNLISQKLSFSLIEFVWSLRFLKNYNNINNNEDDNFENNKFNINNKNNDNNNENFSYIEIRRSVLYSLYICFSILPNYILLSDYINNIQNILNWLLEIFNNDNDLDSKNLSLLILNLLKEKFK